MTANMNCGVYRIVAPNGHFYAGSSNNLRSRERGHFRSLRKGQHHSILLQRAWEKYAGDFKFERMIVCEEKDLFMYEQIVLDNFNPRYNVGKVAGAAMRGRKHTKEALAKIADASKRLWESDPVYRERMTEIGRTVFKGKTHSPETLAKISGKVRAHYEEPGAREAAANRTRGHRHDEETKKKIGVASAAIWAANPEARTKFSADTAERNRAKVWTPEDRAAMAATKNARYASDPDLKRRIAESVKGFKHTDEAKAKIAAASRNRSPESIAKRSASLKAAWALRKANGAKT